MNLFVMKKEITLTEWLEIASSVVGEIALAVKDDGKITLDEAMRLIVATLTAILTAYNN